MGQAAGYETRRLPVFERIASVGRRALGASC